MKYKEIDQEWTDALSAMTKFTEIIHNQLCKSIENGDEWELNKPIHTDYCTILAIAKIDNVIVCRQIKDKTERVCDKGIQPYHANFRAYEKIASAILERKDEKLRYVIHKGKYAEAKLTVCI